MRETEKQLRERTAEYSSRELIKFVMLHLKLLNIGSRGYAQKLYEQKEPYHRYVSNRGNKRDQHTDISILYETVIAEMEINGERFDKIEQKKEKYNWVRR